jgi:hypothetical protein
MKVVVLTPETILESAMMKTGFAIQCITHWGSPSAKGL